MIVKKRESLDTPLISHPSDPKEEKFIWVAILHQPGKNKNCGAIFAAGFSLHSRFCRKWTPLPGKSVKNPSQYRCLVSWDLSEWRIFPNPSGIDSSNLWRIILNKPKIPVTSHITTHAKCSTFGIRCYIASTLFHFQWRCNIQIDCY